MKKIKKLLTLTLATAMSVSLLAGCGEKGTGGTMKPAAPTGEPSIDETIEPTDEVIDVVTTPEPDDTNSPETADVDINNIATVLETIYAEKYLCPMEITEEELEIIWGVNLDDVESFIGRQPMMSAHVDKFLVIKTVNVDSVKTALENYRQMLVDDTFQYPNNIPKIAASEVVDLGDGYVGFFMLGGYNDTLDEASAEYESLATDYYKVETQRGIDAVKNYLNGTLVIDSIETVPESDVVTPEEEINWPIDEIEAVE